MSCKNEVVAGLISGEDLCRLREAVCVQVEKVYDHCKEKDCVEDLVVDFCEDVQELIDSAVKVKTKDVEVVNVFADLEEVPFKPGFYTTNIRYRIKVIVEFCYKDALGNIVVSDPKVGYVSFSKTVILFGSEGKIKIFKSSYLGWCCGSKDKDCGALKEQDNLPNVKIEVAEPLALNTRIGRKKHPFLECDIDIDSDGDTDVEVSCERPRPRTPKKVLVTIGLFSIIKLVRLVQLLIPAFNFCYPNKECIASTDENPCEIFDTIDFPMDQFFPPQKFDFPDAEEEKEEC